MDIIISFGFDNEETQQILEYYHLKLDDKVREMYGWL